MSIYQGLAKKSRWVNKNRGARVAETRPPMKGLFSGNILFGEHADSVIWGMNGAAVARNGPRLWENEAVGFKKVFRGFRRLWDAIYNSKIAAKVRKLKILYFAFFYIVLFVPISP